jgi:5-methylcytosine-specific restriction endonuclease McrA
MSERRRFMMRTANIYRHQAERAAKDNQPLDYTLAQVRELLWPYKGGTWHQCEYCDVELNAETCSLDHRDPVSRTGKHCWSNIAVCCMRCNQVKGNMSDDEYRRLLAGLKLIHPDAAKSIVARLRAGSRVFAA